MDHVDRRDADPILHVLGRLRRLRDLPPGVVVGRQDVATDRRVEQAKKAQVADAALEQTGYYSVERIDLVWRALHGSDRMDRVVVIAVCVLDDHQHAGNGSVSDDITGNLKQCVGAARRVVAHKLEHVRLRVLARCSSIHVIPM